MVLSGPPATALGPVINLTYECPSVYFIFSNTRSPQYVLCCFQCLSLGQATAESHSFQKIVVLRICPNGQGLQARRERAADRHWLGLNCKPQRLSPPATPKKYYLKNYKQGLRCQPYFRYTLMTKEKESPQNLACKGK